MQEMDFDNIRPYTEEEARQAIQRIVKQQEFRTIVAFVFGEEKIPEITRLVTATKSINDFQHNFMRPLVWEILKKTSQGLTTSGFEQLNKGEPHLFIGNHRDITLDSSILASLLNEQDISLGITWGDNLMVSPFVTDLGKVNRMVTVFREGTPREMLQNSQRLSAYLRKMIQQDNLCVWIAQRKGRAKNGDDRTDPGVLKMLSLSGKGSLFDKLKPLNIRPVCVSYEWEPCDIQKVKELYISSKKNYVKSGDEDLKSILGGITGQKGHVHYALGDALNEKMENMPEGITNSEMLQRLTSIIDKEIFKNYRLWPNNFMALDRLNHSREFGAYYNAGTEKTFDEKIGKMLEQLKDLHEDETLTNLLLSLYARPLQNKLENGLPIDLPK